MKKTKASSDKKDEKKGLKKRTSAGVKRVQAEVVSENGKRTKASQQESKGINITEAEIVSPETESRAIPAELDTASDINIDTEMALVPTTHGIDSTDPLVLYLNEVRKYRLLTREEEQKIAEHYFETKDPKAAETLVKSNLRFVVKVAAEYSRFGSKMIDLIQEGNVGLMHAVREFNPYKGARLITYAVWWIRGYIQEFLMRQHSLVRIGTTQNQRKLFYQLQKQKDALDAMGLEPNLQLLSSKLGIPEDEIQDMAQRLSGRDLSFDAPLDSENGKSLSDLRGTASDENPEALLEHQEQIAILNQVVEELKPSLNERELILLNERLLNDAPLTLQEIGEKYKITREAVRQAEARLMKKIKDKLSAKTREPGNED